MLYRITARYYSGVPTLNNAPANTWTTTTDKDNHIGDIYYDSATGYAYRFMKNGNDYLWVQISDSDIATALAEAQDAGDLADSKRRIFITQPIPPYDVGDTWMMGATGDIKTCITARASGTYDASDWSKLNKYTDDTALSTFISGTYSTDQTNLQTQIDGKAETWYQSTDSSLTWTTAAIKAAHLGDLWYKTTDNTTWYYDGTQWVQQNVPDEVFDQIDGKAQIFTSTPTIPYYIGDLWFASTSSEIKVCTTARTSGNYTASDWEKRDKYVDSSAISTAITTYDNNLDQTSVFNKLTNNGLTQGIYLNNGLLYINASYIGSGTIDTARINVANLFAQNITATGNIQFSNSMYRLTADTTTGDITLYTTNNLNLISPWEVELSSQLIFLQAANITATVTGAFRITGDLITITRLSVHMNWAVFE